MFTTASPTPVPVERTVTVDAPTAALLAAVSVRTDVLPVPGWGAKAAVTPAGRFSAVSVALPVKFVRLIVIVVGEFAPCAIVSAVGVALNVIPDVPTDPVTLTDRLAVASGTPGPTPRIVTVDCPAVAPAAAVSVKVDVAPVGGFGENEAVTPAGRFSAESVTFPVKLVRATLIVVTVVPPAGTDTAAGVMVRVTPDVVDAAVTLRLTVVDCAAAPAPVPVTVRVELPMVAPAAALIVSVALVPLALVGEIDVVTPVGAPVTVNATGPVKLLRLIFSVTAPDPPCPTLIVLGVGVSPNEPDVDVTVSVNVFDTDVTPLPAAVTVIGYTPAAVVAATLIVTVPVELLPVVEIDDTVAVTPAGAPVTVTVGVPENPLDPVTVTVRFVDPPCATLALVALRFTAIVAFGSVPSSSSSQA